MAGYRPTHSRVIGYIVWLFGFTGAHRFYFGRPISGTIYFFTLGLLFIGWIVDLFLIPRMEREADIRYTPGPIDYNVAWLLLAFLGFFGIHRLYLGKLWTGLEKNRRNRKILKNRCNQPSLLFQRKTVSILLPSGRADLREFPSRTG